MLCLNIKRAEPNSMKMKSYNAWPISSIFFLVLSNFAIQTSSYSLVAMYGKENYTVGSTFESNLMRVMNDLAQDTSQTGFNTSSYGQNPNKVYGLLQCKGNASQPQCLECAQNVTRNVFEYDVCDQSTYCQIWLDSCYVRYANYSFISVFEKDAGSAVVFDGTLVNRSKSPDVFWNTLNKLLSNLSAEASQDGNKGFAAQSASYSIPSPHKIDAFVEFSRDLSSANCSACLAREFDTLRHIDRPQAQLYHGSCLVRYVSYESTELGNSASKQLLMMWGLIGGLLLSIFAPICP